MLRAIILGLLQGLTEFLPVSSSGHLVLVPYLLQWEAPGLAFSTALHGGTLIALMAYFWGDIWYLATRTLGLGASDPAEIPHARRTTLLLVIGSIPAAIAGVVLEDFFADFFAPDDAAGVRITAVFLLGTAGLLLLAERMRKQRARAAAGADGSAGTGVDYIDLGRDESTVTRTDALIVGVAQALAIFPGISRAGSTIAAGMMRGLSREGSARFSFLLSIPIIAGAALFQLRDLLGEGAVAVCYSNGEIVAGVIAAAISGYWAIRFLLRFVSGNDLGGFARYVALFSILTLIGTVWLGPPDASLLCQ